MRSSDEEITDSLQNKGVELIEFYDYEVDGKSMHYIHVGEAGKPLVLLIHGTPGSAGAFTSYLADSTLREKVQIVAVDRPGLGYSDFGNAERSLQRQAAAIQPILERHQAEKVILMGHSFGGPVIIRLAMDYPEQIDGVVMVAGSVCPELEPREWWRGPLDWLLIRWILPPALRVANQEIMALYDELLLMESLWLKVDMPVTTFQGTEDQLVPPGNAGYAHKMLVNCPANKVNMIEGGNHFILWSLKDDIVAEMLSMLESMDSTMHVGDSMPKLGEQP